MNVANFFRSNSQPTPMQQLIEKATDGSNADEDWDSIMRICDHVSVSDEHAREAMRVIRKRLQVNPAMTGWRPISLTLTLLEALTKNCGKRFHLQIVQRDFLREFRAILAPKNSPPAGIQENILKLIQTWAVAFRDDPDLKSVEQFYQECRQQGIEFPPSESDSVIKASISAKPSVQLRETNERSTHQPAGAATAANLQAAHMRPMNNERVIVRQITAEQLAKLRSELDVVQTNGQIFGEMLVTLQPGEEHPQDLELLTELYQTCKQMQSRIIDLLSQISLDEITVDLLRYNDEFNNSFKTYESYMEERQRRLNSSLPLSQSSAAPMKPARASNEPALIKFDDDSASLMNAIQNLRVDSTNPLVQTTEPINSSSVVLSEKDQTGETEKILSTDQTTTIESTNNKSASSNTNAEQASPFYQIPAPLNNNPDA